MFIYGVLYFSVLAIINPHVDSVTADLINGQLIKNKLEKKKPTGDNKNRRRI